MRLLSRSNRIALYFLPESATVVMLCGGDKGSQRRDIERARRLAQDWRRT